MTSLKEHRLIYRRASDFEDQTRYTTRVAEANKAQQNQVHAQALQDNGVMTSSTPEGQAAQQRIAQNALGNPEQQSILQQAQVSQNTPGSVNYNTQTGKTTPIYTDPRNPTGYVPEGAKVGDQRDLQGIYDDIDRQNGERALSGTQMSPDQIAHQKAAAAQQFAAEQDIERIRQQTESFRVGKSSASDAAAAKQADQQETGNSQLASLKASIASLGPDYAILAEALGAHESADAKQEDAAQDNYESEIGQANASKAAYDTMLNQMQADAKDLNDKGQKFLDQMQTQRGEALARQKESTIEQLKWEENRIARDERRKLDKQISSMTLAQALSGGAGSSNWTAEIAEAEWRGEEAIMDMQKEFGFKRADVDIAFTEQLNNIYETYGRQKLDELKAYRAEKNQINQFRFSATEKTEERKLKAKQDLNDRLAGIAKEQAARIDQATMFIAEARLSMAMEAQKEAKWQYEQQWDEYKFNAQQERLSEQFQIQMEDRQLARDIQRGTMEFNKSSQKVQQIRGDIERNKVMIPYRKDIAPLYENAKKAMEQGDNFLADRALAKIYEKMVEPNSVVMPGEYSDIASSAPFLSKIAGKIDKVLNGGQAWTEKERTQLFELVKGFHATYKQRFDDAAQQFYTDIDWFNSNLADPTNGITYEQVGLPSYSTQSTRSNLEDMALPGMFPDGQGGGEDASAASPYLGMGTITQQFNTPIASRAKGGLYSESTVKAWSGKHAGLDIAIPQGTELPSPISGEIVSAGFEGGWGGTIVIRDPSGAEHRLSHLSEIPAWAKPGAKVNRGQVIAKSGGAKKTHGAGNSTGAHLDYRIRVNGKYVDPLKYRSVS